MIRDSFSSVLCFLGFFFYFFLFFSRLHPLVQFSFSNENIVYCIENLSFLVVSVWICQVPLYCWLKSFLPKSLSPTGNCTWVLWSAQVPSLVIVSLILELKKTLQALASVSEILLDLSLSVLATWVSADSSLHLLCFSESMPFCHGSSSVWVQQATAKASNEKKKKKKRASACSLVYFRYGTKTARGKVHTLPVWCRETIEMKTILSSFPVLFVKSLYPDSWHHLWDFRTCCCYLPRSLRSAFQQL